MKNTRFLLSALACALFFALSGCGTTGSSSSGVPPAVAAEYWRTGTQVGLYEVLKKNPKYLPAAQAMVVGIDVALTGSAVINDASISAFVARVAEQNHMDPEEAAIFAGLARSVYQGYVAKFNVSTGVLISDPNARLYVLAFRNGLSDAVGMNGRH